MARAIENQVFCMGVNRIGIDGYGIKYSGDSAFIDAKGTAIFMNDQQGFMTFELNYQELHSFRKTFPVLNDRDKFTMEEI